MFDPRIQFSHTYDHMHGNKGWILGQDNRTSSNWFNDQEVVQFRPNNHHEENDDDSGVCSPPLWKNSPSPPRSPSHPLLTHHICRSLSPNSRAQAISRGQKELMEMVKNMAETSYELSLKDLVENHRIETQAPQVERLNNSNLQQRGVGKVKRQESKKNEKKTGFENKGLFLKMVFPFSVGSTKKKKNFGCNSSGKVSPKPGGGERDWWKSKFTGSSDSDSSRLSNNSGSNGSSGSSGGSSSGGDRSYSDRRKKKGFLKGCWPFFKSRRSKHEE